MKKQLVSDRTNRFLTICATILAVGVLTILALAIGGGMMSRFD